MELDRIRCYPGLAVVEVEEGDAGNARSSTEPDLTPLDGSAPERASRALPLPGMRLGIRRRRSGTSGQGDEGADRGTARPPSWCFLMPGVFTDPKALGSQHAERAEREARKRAQQLADARESAKVAERIRARYEQRLEQRPDLATTRPSRSQPPYPWQES